MTPQVVALVPMRHDSERVVGKNFRELGGKPLFHHIVSALERVPYVDAIVIDTDSPTIAEDAARSFPDVQILRRPEHLLGGHVPMNDILLHDIDAVAGDLYLQTHSTNPLLSSETLSAACQAFFSHRDEFDSLFGVTALQTRLWWPDGRAINHDPAVLLRTQDLPPVMEENSCVYLFTGDLLRRRRNRIGDRPLLFPIDRHEAWDIDEELDWIVVEALYDAKGSA